MPDENAASGPPQDGTGLAVRAPAHSLEVPREYCPYCGAPLVAELYFCWVCAAPYKSIEAVVTPASPMPLSEGELIRRKAPHVATLFWSYFATVIGGAIIAELLFHDDRPDLKLLLQLTAVLVTTCVFAVMFWTSLKVQLLQPGFVYKEAWIGLAILAPMLAINFGYSRFLMWALSDHHHNILRLDDLRKAGMTEAGLVCIFCIWPAISEEIGFRGLLQHWLQTAIKPERAILLTAFLFATMHFSIVSFPYLFGLGALLGWTKWKTGSLYPSMLIHFLHNLVVIEFF
jgi:membrane protease YdiL (CAAX protease family)